MRLLKNSYIRKNIDTDTVSIKLKENYNCEYDIKIKDVKFLKKHGVVVPMPVSDCNLENSFFDAVIDALFLKFRGLSINFNTEVLSDLTRIPMPKIRKMFEDRLNDGRLSCYTNRNTEQKYYTNPYEKEDW